MGEIIQPNLTGFEWRDVRLAIKRIVEAAAPLATVHAEWKLEFDTVSSLGKILPTMMKGKSVANVGNHSAFIHSYMIGLESETENTFGGDTFATIGGATCDYDLTFALWGFFDYGGWRTKFGTSTAITDDSSEKNATVFAESERRAIKGFFRVNPTLALDSGRVRYTYPIVLESADNHPFSDGKRYIVMQNTLRVRVRESFA